MVSSHPQPSTTQVVIGEIAGLLVELHPGKATPAIAADSRLDQALGFDSLGRMELLSRLERRFDRRIPDEIGLTARTPADLVRALADAVPRAPTTAAAPVSTQPAVALDLPTTATSMLDVLHWHASRRPHQVHVHFDSGDGDAVPMSFGELLGKAAIVAESLRSQRVQTGDRVALMLPTHPDLLIGFFGVLYAGAVPVPLYPPLRADDVADYWRRQAGILDNCGARHLIADPLLHARRRLLRAIAGGVERIHTVSALLQATTAAPLPALSTDALALLQYTSGSTADPKGVCVSHANILANLRAMGEVIGIEADDVFVSWLPLYHDMGLIGAWLGSLYFGIPLVLMPPQRFLLRPERWLQAIDRYQGTLTAAPNFALQLCNHRIGEDLLAGVSLDSLRLCFCGAEPVVPETLQRFANRFAVAGFRPEAMMPVYGLAESTLGVSFAPPGRGPRELQLDRDRFLRDGRVAPPSFGRPTTTLVSCGLPLPGHQLRIADDAGHEMPDDQQGRIEFRGPSACRGYFRNPDANRRLVRDGWHDTGDLGFIHDGELYISGRVKDIIIRAGRNLHPQALEQAVGDVPGVRRGRIAVFGSGDASAGTERLIVVAETRLDDASACAALRERIQQVVIAVAGDPADDVVLAAPGSVLKTSSGKLRRAACRDAYERGRQQIGRRTRTTANVRAFVILVGRGLRARLRVRGRMLRALAFAGYAWLLFGLLAVVATVAIAALPRLDWRWRAGRGLLGVLRAATATPIAVTLDAPLPPSPCVFVANHSSYLDALLVAHVLPRPVGFIAKAELGERRWLRWLLVRMGALFVDRFDPLRSMDAVAVARTHAGDVLFFPEGTFDRAPGLLPFHLGAFATAAHAGRPLVPIALRGTRSMLREWFPRRGALQVDIGAGLTPPADADPWTATLSLASAARAFLLERTGEPEVGAGPVLPMPPGSEH